MRELRRHLFLFLAAVSLICSAGCGREAAPAATADDELLAELSAGEKTEQPPAKPVQKPIRVRSASASRSGQDILRKPKGERLELRLKKGDQIGRAHV